ncbi:hypothetical protein DLD77_01595 [Chitinophaga alhagiae]|uniref:Uncharacterized protein n=1 Tax=Chitinophaga alhagiae TaxID=2203219 RepID=A0ABM6W977_9BACT|nr:hypothetical protein [Chitinophaga alhagiae]AWO00491.1 hypothetical protein DLD77_01595 [Chitinophaga alhagiae]
MRRLFLTFLLLGGLASVSNAQTIQSNALRLPGADVRAVAQMPQAQRDSILLSINYLDTSNIDVPANGMSAAHQQELKVIIGDMLQLVKQVLKEPGTVDEVEKKMTVQNRKLASLREDIAYEENLRILKAGYEEDMRRRTKEYEDKNYNSEKEKRIAKRELEQELRDIRRDYEEERARLKRG